MNGVRPWLLAVLLVLPAMGVAGGGAQAGFVAGTDLMALCKAPSADPLYRLRVSECIGYVIGVADTFDCSEQLHGFHWNSKAAVSQDQLVQTVTTWLSRHPENLHYESDGLVAAALAESYPCK